MNTKHETISRRRFMQKSTAAALLAGMGTYGCSARGGSPQHAGAVVSGQ